jgi:hypothetical protein
MGGRGANEALLVGPFYSVLDGSNVTLKPNGPTFTIPDEWVRANQQAALEKEALKNDPSKRPGEDGHEWLQNLYLSRTDIEMAKDGDRGLFESYAHEWYPEVSDAINPLLNFYYCGFVGGDVPWEIGPIGHCYVRVYVTRESIEEFEKRMNVQGASVVSKAVLVNKYMYSRPSKTHEIWLTNLENAQKIQPNAADINAAEPIRTLIDGWRGYAFHLELSFGDYAEAANINFFIKRFGEVSAIFVFIEGDEEQSGVDRSPKAQAVFSRILSTVQWRSND